MAELLDRSETDPGAAPAGPQDGPAERAPAALCSQGPWQTGTATRARRASSLRVEEGPRNATVEAGAGAQVPAAPAPSAPCPRTVSGPSAEAAHRPQARVLCLGDTLCRTNRLTHESFALAVCVPVNGNMDIPARACTCVYMCAHGALPNPCALIND